MRLECVASLEKAPAVRRTGRSTRPVSAHVFRRAVPASDAARRGGGTSPAPPAPIPQRDGADERSSLARDSHRDGGCGGGQSVQWSFDTIDHTHLRGFLDQRVTDGVIRRMIDKWLKAGVLEKGILHRTTGGTPQGGVISPLLANIYLHYVLDKWFEEVARPRLKGRCQLVRYADDVVIAFEDHLSGKRLLKVLSKRLGRHGLLLHPTKTRFVDFRFKRPDGRHSATVGTTFNFLGFTHVWGRSKKGKNVVRQITAKDRYARALSSVAEWCRVNLHRPFREQHAHLSRVIRGHCAYYGISGNNRRIKWYHHQVTRIWRKWLARRGRHSKLSWPRFRAMLARYPLPPAKIVHQYAVP